MKTQVLSAIAFAGLASSHFVLNWPPPAEFDEELEAQSPCGGVAPDLSSATDVQVGQFAVMIQTTHPEGEWSFYGTTSTEAPYDFTEITPMVETEGIGNFCLQEMSVPTEWEGQSGVIQVIDNSADGVLYQCAPVNFVSGMNMTTGSVCHNSSSVTATWSSEGASDDEPTEASASASSSSSSGVAAIATGMGSLVGGLGLLAAGLVL